MNNFKFARDDGNAACSLREKFTRTTRSFAQRKPLIEGQTHIYARAAPFLRHDSRKRHFTWPNGSDDDDDEDNEDKGKRRKRRPVTWLLRRLPFRVYIGSRSEILRGMHAPSYFTALLPEATSSPPDL